MAVRDDFERAEAQLRAGLERRGGDTGAALSALAGAADTFAALGAADDECLARGAWALLLAEAGDRSALRHLTRLLSQARALDLPELAAELAFARGRLLLAAGEAAEAIDSLRIAADLFAEVGADRPEAQVRGLLVTALHSAGADAGQSLAQLARVAELSMANDTDAVIGRARMLIDSDGIDDGVAALDQAAADFESRGDPISALVVTAAALEFLAEADRWDGLHRSARVLAATTGATDRQALMCRFTAWNYQGQAHFSRNEPDRAIDPARQAAELAARLDEPELAARSRLMLAESLRLAGREAEAIEEYRAVLALEVEVPGLREAAAQRLAEGLRQAQPDRLAELADSYAKAGDLLAAAWCWLREAAHNGTDAGQFTRAAELFDRAGAPGDAARAWYGAARILAMRCLTEPELADSCRDAAIAAATRFDRLERWFEAGTAMFTGATALALGTGRPVTNLMRWCVVTFEQAGRPLEVANSLLVLAHGLTYDEKNAWFSCALRALHEYEDGRSRLQLPADRESNDRQFAWGLRTLTGRLTEETGDPRWPELLWLVEQSTKARAFLDQQHQNELWTSQLTADPALRDLVATIERLTRETDEIDREIDEHLQGRTVDGIYERAAARDRLREQIEDRRRQARDRLAVLADADPARATLTSIAPVPLAELQRCLRPGEAYLGFLHGIATFRILVTAEEVEVEITGDGFDVDAVLAAARSGQAAGDVDAEQVRQLLGEIPQSVDTLIIGPDARLVGVPWHALPWTEVKLLGDAYTVAVVPAAGVLHRLRAAAAAPPLDARYLGVSSSGGGQLPALPCADEEVHGIARTYFRADWGSYAVPVDDEAQFLAQAGRVGLLHLACHADRNGLMLSRDGRWTTPVDLLEQRLTAGIVLLTGCHAGDFAAGDNNEFLGIVRQLLVVLDAKAVIASVAAVPDAAAPIFADLVVAALTGHDAGRPWRAPHRPLPVGAAVEWARTTMAGLPAEQARPLVPDPDAWVDPGDPAFWSPWFVVGDPAATLDR